jgi:hypothetical protein
LQTPQVQVTSQVCVPGHFFVHEPEHSEQPESMTIVAHAWLWPTVHPGAG